MRVCSEGMQLCAAEQVPGAAGHYEVTAELTWLTSHRHRNLTPAFFSSAQQTDIHTFKFQCSVIKAADKHYVTSISHHKLRSCSPRRGIILLTQIEVIFSQQVATQHNALGKTFQQRIKNPFFPLNTSHEPRKLLTKLLLSPGKC